MQIKVGIERPRVECGAHEDDVKWGVTHAQGQEVTEYRQHEVG